MKVRSINTEELSAIIGGDAGVTRQPGQNSYGEWTVPLLPTEPGLGVVPFFGFAGSFGKGVLKLFNHAR